LEDIVVDKVFVWMCFAKFYEDILALTLMSVSYTVTNGKIDLIGKFYNKQMFGFSKSVG
jgi:hypothetical protein